MADCAATTSVRAYGQRITRARAQVSVYITHNFPDRYGVCVHR